MSTHKTIRWMALTGGAIILLLLTGCGKSKPTPGAAETAVAQHILATLTAEAQTTPTPSAEMESTVREVFEAWAQEQGEPYRDVMVKVEENDSFYATVRVVAWFRPSRDAPWEEREATVECRRVGESWQCDEWFDFQATAGELARRAQATAAAPRGQDKALYWQRYDVDITVRTDGDMRIVETQELVFTSGTFRYGQREIALNRLSNISDVTVAEEGGPQYTLSSSGALYTYSVVQDGGYLKVRYNFPPSTGTRRTIVIGYTVSGALRYYPDNGVDQLYWKAIPGGNPFPTQSATITLHLPEGATFTNYGLYGAEGEAAFQPGQRDAMIEVKGRLDAGQEVEVVAEWPHGIVAGTPQPWQP